MKPPRCRHKGCNETDPFKFDLKLGGQQWRPYCIECTLKILELRKEVNRVNYHRSKFDQPANPKLGWLNWSWVEARPVFMAHRYLIIYRDQVRWMLK